MRKTLGLNTVIGTRESTEYHQSNWLSMYDSRSKILSAEQESTCEKTTKPAVTLEHTPGTEQIQFTIADSDGQCYTPSAMGAVTNAAFRRARQECATPSIVTEEKPVPFGSAIVRSITAPPKVVREPRVLLIDDDPGIEPLVSAALVPFDVRVDSVTSGTDAITRLQSQRYNLLVLDLMLGDLHGFEVLRHMKADRRFRETKVLVLTADSRLEALARSFGHGADDFVKSLLL